MKRTKFLSFLMIGALLCAVPGPAESKETVTDRKSVV